MNLINKTFVTITDKIKGDNLKARSARGAAVLGIGTVGERFLRLVRNMILARLLVPDEFGLMAIVLAAAVALEAFNEVGVKQSVIHNKKGAGEEYLNVAWWFQAIRGLALFLVAFLAAPLISSFYENPRLLPLLRVAFVGIALNGMISPRVYVLEKEIRFGKWVFLYQGSGLVGTLVSLGIALFAVRSVWALIIGFLAEAVFRCLLSFVLCPFLPRVHIDRESLTEVLKYARRMLGVPILGMIAFEMDVLVLGKVVAAELLGMYWLGRQLTLQLNALYSKVIHPILLPAFAEKQENRDSLCKVLTTVSIWTAVLGIPITTFLVVCADSVLSVVYVSKYGAVAIPFGLLSVYVFLLINECILAQAYLAIGKPQVHRRFILIRTGLIVCLIFPGISLFGVAGAPLVLIVANLIGLCVQVFWLRGLIGLRLADYAVSWVPGLRLAPIVIVPVILLRYSCIVMQSLDIMVGGLACLVACAVGSFLQKRVTRSHVVFSEGTARP